MALLKRALCIALVVTVLFSGFLAGFLTTRESTKYGILGEVNQSLSPKIQNVTIVNLNLSQSKTISIPIDNLGSPYNWTNMRLSYPNTEPGIKITTDPFLFIDSIVQANSDTFSLKIGISVANNLSLGSYTIPFSLTAKSSFLYPFASTTVNFNLVIIVQRSQPRPLPMILVFPPFILMAGLAMIGIISIWSRDWNISEVKK